MSDRLETDSKRPRTRPASAPVGGHLDGHGERLAGRVAVVSGAGSAGELLGTGVAVALLFAAQGAVVGVLDVSPERAERTRSLVEQAGGIADVLVADVTDEAAVRTAVNGFAGRHGRLDILVNNVGVVGATGIHDAAVDAWDRVFAVNVTGAMLLSRAAHAHLVHTGGGSIVNVSSIAALRGFGSGAYAASKGALLAMTTDLAYSWGPDGIRVNCLVAGHLHTPMGDHGGPDLRERRRRANLLGVEGTAWDLAWAALFLAGPESQWITGVALPVDAGTITATGLGMLGRLTLS